MHTERQKALLDIQQSINRKGFFTYIVEGGVDPRFAYTIGLSSKLGYELIFGGGAYFSNHKHPTGSVMASDFPGGKE